MVDPVDWGAGDVTGETPDVSEAVTVDVLPFWVSVSVTGHTVVEMGMVDVTTTVDPAGQLVTEAAQLVIVISLVVYTVDVVHLLGEAVVAGEV